MFAGGQAQITGGQRILKIAFRPRMRLDCRSMSSTSGKSSSRIKATAASEKLRCWPWSASGGDGLCCPAVGEAFHFGLRYVIAHINGFCCGWVNVGALRQHHGGHAQRQQPIGSRWCGLRSRSMTLASASGCAAATSGAPEPSNNALLASVTEDGCCTVVAAIRCMGAPLASELTHETGDIDLAHTGVQGDRDLRAQSFTACCARASSESTASSGLARHKPATARCYRRCAPR